MEQARRADLIGDHDYVVANPTKGEPVGERGLPNQDYQRGRKSVDGRINAKIVEERGNS